MSDVSDVINFFATANEGFITTLGSPGISSGATTVPLAGVAGLTDGTVFVGIIEPGATNQQVFTGTVDVADSQIIDVVWTRGTNVPHVTGVTIVDYVTGTAFNMMAAGITVQHTQQGTHKAITNTGGLTTDTLDVTGTSVFTGDTTLGGALSVAGDLTLADQSVTDTFLQQGKIRARQGGSTTVWGTAGASNYDTNTGNVIIQTGVTATSSGGTVSVTFPVAFSQNPIIIGSQQGSVSTRAFCSVDTSSATGFTLSAINTSNGRTTTDISWIAIGPA